MESFYNAYGRLVVQSSIGKIIKSKITQLELAERIVISLDDSPLNYTEVDNPRLSK